MKSLTNLTDSFFDQLGKSISLISQEDIKCFSKALARFCASGKKNDAFDVFFCFSEVFHLFGAGYENIQKLLELLADHEYHAGELLMKHRDHYVHSAYVFALGLALYVGDEGYRREFVKFYGLGQDEYFQFAYLWGMTSLFHDIGYPFQLAHEQIKAYTSELSGGQKATNPYVSFANLDAYLAISPEENEYLKNSLNAKQNFASLDELLSYGVWLREGYEQEIVFPLLRRRVVEQSNFLDHGYFSAVLFGRLLLQNKKITPATLDVITAHLLHNSFNKFDYPSDKAHPISISEHPLAYLLMLCDELQIWDRVAYGENSKKEPLPWTIRLTVFENMLDVTYVFDTLTIRNLGNVPPTDDPNKNVQKIESGKFVSDIFKFISSKLMINAKVQEKAKEKNQKRFASSDSFVNLCDFAMAVHASYLDNCLSLNSQHITQSFGNLSLELKMSNIAQAKSYAEKLELINCFYSDKDLDYPVVESFSTEENIDVLTNEKNDDYGFLCREEHLRWVKEKLNMGWKYGTSYLDENGKANYTLRQKLKEHADLVPFECLTEQEQEKDGQLIRSMIPLLYKLGGGVRIYRYRYGRKPDLNVAAIGHRNFVGDREQIKERIKEILKMYTKNYRVIVRSCFAYGADQLIAECAAELNLTLKAELPMGYEDYIRAESVTAKEQGYKFGQEEELRMRHLLAQTVVCNMASNEGNAYLEAAKRVINKCNKVIAIWDGIETQLYDQNGNPTNRGGTYHCLHMAKIRGLIASDIHIIGVER